MRAIADEPVSTRSTKCMELHAQCEGVRATLVQVKLACTCMLHALATLHVYWNWSASETGP